MFLVLKKLSLIGNSEKESAITVWGRCYDKKYKVVLPEHQGGQPSVSPLAYRLPL